MLQSVIDFGKKKKKHVFVSARMSVMYGNLVPDEPLVYDTNLNFIYLILYDFVMSYICIIYNDKNDEWAITAGGS